MSLSSGARLGAYEVIAKLGEGGMGEVYRARDTRLKREVAIKVLPEAFSQDPDRLERFQREAELLATLNHPGIAAVHGLEQSADGASAIVLELVPGDTLADRILRGPLALDDALAIARQIADALEAAHEKGVIHRDLKPANIKVTPGGQVKVLDFGLAKMLEGESTKSAMSHSPTLSVHATYAGVILGTAAYMSPEQARGKPVDRRTDVWAFGCVLFEMLTGRQTFDAGDTVSDAVASILKNDPDWSALPSDTPEPVRRLLRRSLAKDRQRRLSDIGVARLEIDEALTTPSAGEAIRPRTDAPARPFWKRAAPIVATAILVGALAGAAAWIFKPAPPLALSRSRFILPAGQQWGTASRQNLSISPDGTKMAYAADGRLYLRALSEFEARPIPGTESAQGGASNPTFSPDGTAIAFYADGALRRVPLTGGTATTLCPADFLFGVSWSAGEILFGQPGKGIMRVPDSGGTPEVLVPLTGSEVANSPQMLPGNRAVLFSVATGFGADRWNTAHIVVQPLGSGERKTLVEGSSDARYLPSGHLVYAHDGSLHAIRFDARALEVTGRAVPVVSGVQRAAAAASGAGTAQFSVSDTGTLIYVPGPASLTEQRRTLVLINRDGGIEPLKLPPDAFESPRISPDGTQLAVGLDNGREASVWIYSLSGGVAPRRLTFGGKNKFPLWSADGQRVAFQSDRDGDAAIFWQRADGTDTAVRLTNPEAGTSHIPEAWWPKDDRFSFSVMSASGTSLWTFSVADRKAAPFGEVRSPSPLNSAVSPDGRWIAYTHRAGPAANVFVEPVPPTGAKFQISKVNGHHPIWMPDGKALSYRIGTTEQVVVDFRSEPALAVGSPVRVPADFAFVPFAGQRNYDILPDGKRFLLATPGDALKPAAPEIDVVLNWFEELRRLVPAGR